MAQSVVYRPDQHSAGLLVIDIQEKFRPAIASFDAVIAEAVRLVRAFGILRMPVIATEQYPQGLGPTVKPIIDALPPKTVPLVKKCFSCCGADGFIERLERTGVTALALCGVETHVCVYQTALDLIAQGHTVIAIANAMASRKEPDHVTALRRIEQSGGIIMTVEMLLFDLLRTADAPDFREIQKLVK
jgi:nicotinamidase-related amidase